MQMNMNLNVPVNTKNAWAFAVDITKKQTGMRKRGKRMVAATQNFNHCVITAVSREARALGVRAGMKYTEAKALIPDLRILITNG